MVEDKNRQMTIMYEMHAGCDVTEEITVKGIGGHIGINKTVERIASRYYVFLLSSFYCDIFISEGALR